MTFRTVYKGTAINIPKAPAIKPAKIIIINISKGWDLTLFENIYGCEIKLSINCPMQKPINTPRVFGKTEVPISRPRFEVRVRKVIKNPPISGPKYGIIFNNAQINAIVTAFLTPKISNIRE